MLLRERPRKFTYGKACPTHEKLTPNMVEDARREHPNAVFFAHPECRPEVLALADAIRSTSGMVRCAKESDAKQFIVGTEIGLLYSLKKANPEKEFFIANKAMGCPNMKKITLDNVVQSLENLTGEVKVPEEIRLPALKAVKRMIAIPGK